MAVLVTGGAGYIGSHTCVALLASGYEVVVVDNLANSKYSVIERIRQLSKKDLSFYEGDVLDREFLAAVFAKEKIDAVIHFSGFKAVGESVFYPWKYYYNNICGTLVLLEVMKQYQVNKIVFSSSATVYGNNQQMPLIETMPTSALSPYGRTKLMIEQILTDQSQADNNLNVAVLRYFNPIGAHPSGIIGEDPQDIPNNLMPYITQVACGKMPILTIFGNDYPTKDGTGIRDYIHVMDLAEGHLAAMEYLNNRDNGLEVFNLGTGIGYSVLEVITTFEEVNGLTINYRFDKRRPGDTAECYADATKAKEVLMWSAKRDLKEMCRDSYHWQKNNPRGYEE